MKKISLLSTLIVSSLLTPAVKAFANPCQFTLGPTQVQYVDIDSSGNVSVTKTQSAYLAGLKSSLTQAGLTIDSAAAPHQGIHFINNSVVLNMSGTVSLFGVRYKGAYAVDIDGKNQAADSVEKRSADDMGLSAFQEIVNHVVRFAQSQGCPAKKVKVKSM